MKIKKIYTISIILALFGCAPSSPLLHTKIMEKDTQGAIAIIKEGKDLMFTVKEVGRRFSLQ
ncbi:MAG: hypothetical protein JAY90_01470 [Candidatus Thiodiazotropha lotti]|nr:hypothetical protein [Candidatus Thiodiazotropha lotti]